MAVLGRVVSAVGEKVLGNGKAETLKGGLLDDVMFGEGKNDVMSGNAGNDRMHGGGGDDTMAGEDGDDVMFGATTLGGKVDVSKLVVTEQAQGKVTFLGESAGYQNALGMYKIAADGTIYDVDILFANASLKDSGGSLVAGKSSVEFDLKPGDKLGFFIVPNGFAQKDMPKVLGDEKGSFKLVAKDGSAGNVNSGSELKLVHVSAKGQETVVKSAYGESLFHSHGGAEGGLNGDGYKHVVGEVDTATGSVTIGFEDLWQGGDKDFDDAVFRLDIGQTNAALLAKEGSKVSKSTDDDVMSGGTGADKMFGMAGNDVMNGDDGDDAMWGNSGDDVMDGGAGNDTVAGGKGDDVLMGGDGDDVVRGDTGDDVIDGGTGDDELSGGSGNDMIADGDGADTVDGGSGDDIVVAGEGDDTYDGGSGFDTLVLSNAKGAVTVDLHAKTVVGLGNDVVSGFEAVVGSEFDDTFKGDKTANTFDGGAGDDAFRGLGGADVFTGGEGKDSYVWFAKDIVDEKGKHLGIDRITDFSLAEDTLDLSEVLKKQTYGNLDEVVAITDTKDGANVAVRIGDTFVDVVTLDGIAAADLLQDGLILA